MTDTLVEQLQDNLKEYGLFNKPDEDNILFDIVKCLDTRLEDRMKLQLVVHSFINLISNLRIPISIDNQLVPINSIAFLFSPSGSGKDSTINKINGILSSSVELILDKRNQINFEQAEKLLRNSKEKNVELNDFLLKLPPLDIGISTVEGLTSSLEVNQRIPLGSINVNTNEFIAEMNSNQATLIGMLSAVAEMYDLGNKQSKQLKDKSKEVGNLKNVFINALLTSSYNVYDRQDIRASLSNEFQSKLARRSSITFSNTVIPEPHYDNIEDMIDKMIETKGSIYTNIDTISDRLKDIIAHYLENPDHTLFISPEPETFRLYLKYQLYCRHKSSRLNSIEYKLSSLNIANRYWQALKLSGAIALYNKEMFISKESFILAVQIVEIINNDIFVFEKELNKEVFELFIDYCEEGIKESKEFSIPLFKLKKLNFISGKGNDISQVNSLINTCSSREELNGIFRFNNNVLTYEKLETTNDIGITFKELKGISKEDRGKYLGKEGWSYKTVPFEALEILLKKDYAYNFFEYTDNVKVIENILPFTNVLVFDIDKGDYSIDKMHELLTGVLDHHISTTSNKSNLYKYRLIVPLKQKFKVNKSIWKDLLKSIAKDYLFGIEIDRLSISQAFYSYKDSIVYSDIQGNKLDIKPYLTKLESLAMFKKPLTSKEKEVQLKNTFSTFQYAFNAKEGTRNHSLISAINHAFDLGASKEQCIDLVRSINEYWEDQLEEKEIETNIMPHINKKYGG